MRCLRCRHQLPQDARPQRHLAPLLRLPQPRPTARRRRIRRCPERNIRADALDTFVFDHIRAAITHPDLLLAGEQAVAVTTPIPDDELLTAELARLDRKIDAADTERRRLIDLYQGGFIELPETQRRAAEVSARRNKLQHKRTSLADERTALARDNQLRHRVHDFAARIHAVIDTLDDTQKQQLLRLLIEDVRVTGWHVQIRLRIALDPPPPNHHTDRPNRQTVPPHPRPVSTQDGLRSVGDDDFGVVDEAVDHGGGHDVVAEHFAPAAEGLVGGDDEAGSLVAGGHQLEEQVGGFGFERDVADLIDDDQRVAAQPDEFGLEPAGVMGFGQAGDPFGGGGEEDAVSGLAGPDRRPIARWVLPVPGGPRNTILSLAVTKSNVPRCAMVSRLRPRAWSKSNSSNDFRAGNRAARIRPSPPWDSRAETSRCRHAARNSSWVQFSARARSASRARDSRKVGAFRARVRYANSAVTSRPAAGLVGAIRRPPHRETQSGVIVGQVAYRDLDSDGGGRH